MKYRHFLNHELLFPLPQPRAKAEGEEEDGDLTSTFSEITATEDEDHEAQPLDQQVSPWTYLDFYVFQ